MVKSATWLLVVALKVLAWAVILCVPLLGIWTASSMAAWANSVPWLAVVAGLLAFPLLPLGWDALSELRRRRKARAKNKAVERILTTSDRLLWRTLLVNVLFVGSLMVWFPQPMSNALSVRGDWFLDGHHGPMAERTRAFLLGLADQMQWLWEASVDDNPFEEMNEFADDQPPPPSADELAEVVTDDADIDEIAERATETPTADPDAEDSGDEPGQTSPPRDPRRWPMANDPHPAIARMPASARTSIESVARYVAAEEPDKLLQLKALHDFVAQHVDYDAPALAEGRYPPQDAETVFAQGIGVCAGYANLMVALGKVIDLEIVYVTGHSRDAEGDISGQGHAWNAARIEGRWYLIDVTWDAGYVDGAEFTEQYATDYLMTPPRIFALNHLPRDERWQLLETPMTRGEFVRQVPLRPSFYSAGLELRTPTRSQSTVEGTARVEIGNPNGKYLLATWRSRDDGRQDRCTISGREVLVASCELPAEGTYTVELFMNDAQFGEFAYIGGIEFNNDP